jgi:hypothetical protein
MEPTCWYCENALSPGEPYWSIQTSRETKDGDRVTVESEVVWLTLCPTCAEMCNLSAGPDIEWEAGRLTLLLAHEAAEPAVVAAPKPRPAAAPSQCPHCHKPVVAGDAFCMACGGAVQ